MKRCPSCSGEAPNPWKILCDPCLAFWTTYRTRLVLPSTPEEVRFHRAGNKRKEYPRRQGKGTPALTRTRKREKPPPTDYPRVSNRTRAVHRASSGSPPPTPKVLMHVSSKHRFEHLHEYLARTTVKPHLLHIAPLPKVLARFSTFYPVIIEYLENLAKVGIPCVKSTLKNAISRYLTIRFSRFSRFSNFNTPPNQTGVFGNSTKICKTNTYGIIDGPTSYNAGY